MDRLPEVRDAFGALARSIKRIAIYRHARDQHESYLAPALQALVALLAGAPEVTVQVEPAALIFEGEIVYSEPAREGSLCFRLHRDGVRTLTFSRGLDEAELLTFMNVALPDEVFTSGREDAVTELWKANLKSISYRAVSGYRMEQSELDREAVQNAIADVSERAGTILQRFGSGLDEEAARRLPAAINDVERDALEAGDWGMLARRVIMTLLQIFQRVYAGRDLDALIEAYGRLIDEMIERRDTDSLGLAIGRPTGMQGPQAAPFRIALGKRLADPLRARGLLELARTAPTLLAPWIALLPDEAGAVLLEVLDEELDPGCQVALARAAAARLDFCRTAFGDRLREGPPELVATLLEALRALPVRKGVGAAAVALRHKDPNTRLQALSLVALDASVAIHVLPPLLYDEDAPLREAAVQCLAGLRGRELQVAQALIAALEHPALERADRAEQVALHRQLGRLQTKAGLAWLVERLAEPKRRLLVRSKRSEETQLLAVQGLAADGSEGALKALEVAAASSGAAGVAAASAAALHRVVKNPTGPS